MKKPMNKQIDTQTDFENKTGKLLNKYKPTILIMMVAFLSDTGLIHTLIKSSQIKTEILFIADDRVL